MDNGSCYSGERKWEPTVGEPEVEPHSLPIQHRHHLPCSVSLLVRHNRGAPRDLTQARKCRSLLVQSPQGTEIDRGRPGGDALVPIVTAESSLSRAFAQLRNPDEDPDTTSIGGHSSEGEDPLQMQGGRRARIAVDLGKIGSIPHCIRLSRTCKSIRSAVFTVPWCPRWGLEEMQLKLYVL